METQQKEDNQKMEKRWEKVTLKEETALYMEMKTGELSLENPEVDEEWGMYKSTTTVKVAYYCQQNGEWNGPRDTTKPKEKETKEKKTMMLNECQTQERAEGVETGEVQPHPTNENREGTKRERGKQV